MPKCQSCTFDDAVWSWQPLGPGEDANVFVMLGSHYRGFPVIKICDDCKGLVQEGTPIEFVYKGQKYIGNIEKICAVPEYVGDPLAWWEEELS